MSQRIRETLAGLLPLVAVLVFAVARRWWP